MPSFNLYCRALMVAAASQRRSALPVSRAAAFVVLIVVLAIFRNIFIMLVPHEYRSTVLNHGVKLCHFYTKQFFLLHAIYFKVRQIPSFYAG